MFSVALLSLMLPLATPAPAANSFLAGATRASAADPSIRVSLDRRDYEPGDEARVTVSVRDDGYLLVLRLSPDGYVRVLFPLDPGDDSFVRGNGSYEIRGRGDRSAFTVSSSSGAGTVYAAWSTEPFRFDDYVLGDHWDYRVLDGSQIQGDPEAGLTELAQRMSTGHFDYDLTGYSVERQVAYSGTTHYVTMYPSPYPYSYPYPYSSGCYYGGWCGSRSFFSVSIGFGWGGWRSAWYDPYYYDPFYGPYYYRPYYRSYPVYYGCYGWRDRCEPAGISRQLSVSVEAGLPRRRWRARSAVPPAHCVRFGDRSAGVSALPGVQVSSRGRARSGDAEREAPSDHHLRRAGGLGIELHHRYTQAHTRAAGGSLPRRRTRRSHAAASGGGVRWRDRSARQERLARHASREGRRFGERFRSAPLRNCGAAARRAARKDG